MASRFSPRVGLEIGEIGWVINRGRSNLFADLKE